MAPLDAVRGVAIALVMLRHALPGVFGGGGFVGVEVFFVLSGFLITSVVSKQVVAGSFTFTRFYRNRILRLVPGLAALVFVMTVLEIRQHGDAGHALGAAVVALAYVADFALVLGLPQLSHLNHLWTLAIEEQFYFLWPAIIVISSRRKVSSRVVATASFAAGIVLLVASTATFHRPDPLYVVPSTWALALLAGCALSLFGLPEVRPAAAWAATAIVILSALFPGTKGHLASYLILLPAVAVLSAVMISNAASARPIAILSNEQLQRLGLVSYGAYLWNVPVSQTFSGLPSVPLTIAAAVASYFANLRSCA